MPDAAHAIREISLPGMLWTMVLTLPPAVALCLFPASPACAEISEKPLSTRQATRGVNTPVIRPDEYNAKMNEARAQEQKLIRNLPRNGHATPRFRHTGKNERPQTSADRSPLTRR